MRVGYIRVSTEEQNLARQEALAREAGVEKVFAEKASGKNANRLALKEMLDYVRDGDQVVVESISRIARNTKDLLDIIQKLQEKGVEFVSLKENIDTATATGKFMLTVFGALAELERENILQRQKEGIEIAKQNNVYKGRKPMTIDEDKFVAMCREWRNGKRTAVSVQKAFDITGTTFYRWVKEKKL